jgi:hypothetical protein
VIELTVAEHDHARAVSERVANLVHSELETTIERRLAELGEVEGLVRIDRIELDLGRVPLAGLEDGLARALEQTLPPALARAVAAASARASHPLTAEPDRPLLDLLAAFARDGRLPWWSHAADRGMPEVMLAEAALTAAREMPAALAALLRTLARERHGLTRLVLQLDDTALAACAAALSPTLGQTAAGLAAALTVGLATAPSSLAFGTSVRRRQVWLATLHALMAGPADAASLEAAALDKLAAALGITPARLRADLAVARDALQPDIDSPTATADDVADRLAHRLRAAAAHGLLAPLLRALAEAATGLPTAAAYVALAALDALLQTAEDLGDPALRSGVAALMRPFAAAGRLDPEALTSALAPLRAATLEHDLAERGAPPPSQATAGADGRVAVADAGLCLLWPFLSTLLGRVGLLAVTGGFHSEVARHRAVALLDHVATGEVVAAEGRLPLAKLLCGMALGAVHEPGEPLDATERAEVDLFLQAMLEHLRPLGRLSVEGLRASWLLRPGLLGTRDGAWLLRVEQRSYDILLDRLAWRLEWIRLPWMPFPLRVEW